MRPHISQEQINLRVELAPNPYGQHLNAVRAYTLGLLLPVLLFHIMLFSFFSVATSTHLLCLGVFACSMGFLTKQFLKRSYKRSKRYLIINESHFELKAGKQIISRMDRENTRIETIGWGPCEEALLPAVRIIHESGKVLTIGASFSERTHRGLSKSVQATDFILAKEMRWGHFRQYLK